jgi:hypothetical protein
MSVRSFPLSIHSLSSGQRPPPTWKTKRRKLDSPHPTLYHHRLPAIRPRPDDPCSKYAWYIHNAYSTRYCHRCCCSRQKGYNTQTQGPAEISLKFTLFLWTQISEYYSTKNLPPHVMLARGLILHPLLLLMPLPLLVVAQPFAQLHPRCR